METPRKFITAKLSIQELSYYYIIQFYHIISTDEDPGLRIESIAVINLRGVNTNLSIILYVLSPCKITTQCNSANIFQGVAYPFTT